MKGQAQESFSGWLKQTLALISRRLDLWFGYAVFMYVPLASCRVSLALGIFLSVTCLFTGVAVAEFIDTASVRDKSKSLIKSIKITLPLAMSMAALIVICWLIFRMVFNLYTGEPEKILQFIFNWELTDKNFADKDPRQFAIWLYKPAIASMIFSLLMFISFVSWFSYPLMAFKKYNWVDAKYRGREAANEHRSAVYKLVAFVLLLSIAGTGILPMVTPLFFSLISSLMYVSYKGVFCIARKSGD